MTHSHQSSSEDGLTTDEKVDFKLIKMTKQNQNVLCSIIDIEHSSGSEFNRQVWKVWEIALRFLSCLSWELNIGIVSGFYGGCSWRKEYGGLKIEQAKKLKGLEKENAQLKKLVADLSLDNSILKEAAEGNF